MKPSSVKETARERIAKLFKLASEINDQALANRYVELARKLAMKARISLEPEHRRFFCHGCYAYLSLSVSRRVKDKVQVVHCPFCEKINRYPFS